MASGSECPKTFRTDSYGISPLITELASEDLNTCGPCFLAVVSIPALQKYIVAVNLRTEVVIP